jgi:hypothetical protein
MTLQRPPPDSVPQMDRAPRNIKEARKRPDAQRWRGAEDAELALQERHRTWDLVPLPDGEKAVSCTWVYTIKADGTFKARLVARGDQQPFGEVGETWSPVCKMSSLRILFAVAAGEDLHCEQFDVIAAFLQSEGLDVPLYMHQPPGHHQGPSGTVCRLNKAIYGLKEAPRAWHMTLRKKLLERGFVVCEADPSLFILWDKSGRCVAAIYVDDGIVAARDAEAARRLVDIVASCFEIRRMGEPKMILGMNVTRDKAAGTITLSQKDAIAALLEKYAEHMPRGEVTVPSQPGSAHQLCSGGQELSADATLLYPSLVGSLQHLANSTRPDIAYAVGVLGRYSKQPRQPHWDAALRVLRYLRGTQSRGITYGGTKGLRVYCDADHAGCVDTRRSTTGAVTVLHGGAVDWSSTLQSTVAASTCEAEYQAAGVVVRMALWLRKILTDLGLDAQGRPAAAGEQLQPIVVDCDNQGAIALLNNPASTRRSKHIDIIHHFARDRVEQGQVEFKYCPSAMNVSDCFTKSLGPTGFNSCLAGMGVGI